jgi:hypothetical protein
MRQEPLPQIDPASAVPAPQPVSEDEEFTSLSVVSVDCDKMPNPTSVSPSSSRFLVILTSASAMDPGELQGLGVDVHLVQRYNTLPLLEVEATPERAQTLLALPGVDAVFPALGNADAARLFAVGFDLLGKLAATQRQMLPQAPFGGTTTEDVTGYPILVAQDDGRWLIEPDASARWPTPPAVLPVLNLSVGPKSATYPFAPNDLVNVATFAASKEMLVVVAAGNCGTLGMSAWATPTWVLAVGATSDKEGTELAEYSSRGPSDGSTPGPDLVAWGTIYVNDEPLVGTSYAAPRVTGMARLITAAFVQLGRHVRLAQGAPPHGVPLIGTAGIDRYGARIWQTIKGLQDVPALPILGVRADRVRDLIDVTTAAQLSLNVRANPDLLREILIASTTPVPGRGPHEVGAGFVDEDRVMSRLAALTGLDLVRWFGGNRNFDPALLTEPVRNQLASIQVFDRDELDLLSLVLRATGPLFMYDWRTGRVAFEPVSESTLALMNLDEQLNGIEVRLDGR